MSRLRKIAAVSAIVLLLVGAGALFSVRRALSEVQPFYARALSAAPRELADAADELEEQVAELSTPDGQGEWQAAFTDRQINAWLAEWLAEKGEDLLPDSVSDVRIAIDGGRLLVGFRYQDGPLDTIITVEATARSTNVNEVELTFHKATAGALPLPLAKVKQQLDKAAATVGIPVKWSEVAGTQVAQAELGVVLAAGAPQRALSSVTLGEGRLEVAGRTLPVDRIEVRTAQRDAERKSARVR